jgi:serine/threonine-protein kinase
VWVLAVSVLLVGLGYWTYRAVETSLRDIRASTMKTLLDSQVAALRIWIAEETGDAERVAREPRVREAIAALAGRPLCTGPARERLEELLRPLLRDVGDATFNVVGRDGLLLVNRFADYCGLRTTERFRAELEPVFQGKSRFVRPFRDEDRVGGAQRLRQGPSFAWIATPVLGRDGAVAAALGIAEPVDAVFSAILARHTGEGGVAFAFDESGRVLTADRFGEQSAVQARGGGAAADGVALDPYLSHRGAQVIGAWRWLPEYGMGVALEIESAQAYAPLRYLNIAFGVVFGALVIAAFAALVSFFSVARLRREMGDGRKLGPYRLLRRIGEGGMATVHLARHDLLKRPTAVKLLKPAHATDEMVARFEREVQMASSLAHPNTVEIFDYGLTRDGLFYYAMEYLDGMSVGEILTREPFLPVARTVHILRQVCAALTEAHGKGLVHRDIKPENIMVCRYGGSYDFVKILDFGLVKSMTGQHSRDLTRNLRILGTPLYMAPERLRDPADVDARADVYAVGAVAFLMLTGKKLFDSTDDLQLTTRILNEEARRPSEAASQPVPMELDLMVLACLEKKREDRPQRIADLLEALEALALELRWTQQEAQAWWAAVPPAAPMQSGNYKGFTPCSTRRDRNDLAGLRKIAAYRGAAVMDEAERMHGSTTASGPRSPRSGRSRGFQQISI